MSDKHGPELSAQDGSFRGGCQVCTWLGPHRDDVRDAVTDAQQHALHVQLYPVPDSHRKG
jgi:hypothetical protein